MAGGGIDVTALAVALVGASGGGWAFLQSRTTARDRRRDKQAPALQQAQALKDERDASRAAYDRLTAENERLDKALGDAYTDLDQERQRVRDIRADFEKLLTEHNALQHQHDVLQGVHELTVQKLTEMTAHAASLETTALHVAISHQHDTPDPTPDDDHIGP